MEQLTLKDLLPYATHKPYGILSAQGMKKFISGNPRLLGYSMLGSIDIALNSCETEKYRGYLKFDNQKKYSVYFNQGDILLALRPYEDLTESEIKNLNDFFSGIKKTDDINEADFMARQAIVKGIEYLYSLHIDLLGLIQKGLAVNINDYKDKVFTNEHIATERVYAIFEMSSIDKDNLFKLKNMASNFKPTKYKDAADAVCEKMNEYRLDNFHCFKVFEVNKKNQPIHPDEERRIDSHDTFKL